MSKFSSVVGGFVHRVKGSIPSRSAGPYLLTPHGILAEVGVSSYHNGGISFRGSNQTITIGSYCAIGRDVLFVAENHDYTYCAIQGSIYRDTWGIAHPGATAEVASRARTKGPIRVGSDVWIADRVIVLSGVTIGDGCCIAAGAIVVDDIPPFAIAAGVPARVVGYRFDENVRAALQQLRWWSWQPDRIARNRKLFTTPLDGLTPDELDDLIASVV